MELQSTTYIDLGRLSRVLGSKLLFNIKMLRQFTSINDFIKNNLTVYLAQPSLWPGNNTEDKGTYRYVQIKSLTTFSNLDIQYSQWSLRFVQSYWLGGILYILLAVIAEWTPTGWSYRLWFLFYDKNWLDVHYSPYYTAKLNKYGFWWKYFVNSLNAKLPQRAMA